MITPSNSELRLQTSLFSIHNYKKTATIGKFGEAHACQRHMNKEAFHKQAMRKRSSMVAGRANDSVGNSHRAVLKQRNRRSFRYTRTLDIIVEEQQAHSSEKQYAVRRLSEDENDAYAEKATILKTDFWHSMQRMKKSATSASLDSLISEAIDDDVIHRDSNQPNDQGNPALTDDKEGYDIFFEDFGK